MFRFLPLLLILALTDSFTAVQSRSPRNLSQLFSLLSAGSPPGERVVVIDWECLVDTVSYRIPIGIQTALQVWPSLPDLLDEEDDLMWLHNKLEALSHVLRSPPTRTSSEIQSASPTVEYALATRLLLEEQELDQGESIGKRGRYASKFHPRQGKWSASSVEDKPSDGSRSTTRPLTVGEISVNWKESIRETLEFRYHVEFQPPIPILQSAVENLQVDSNREGLQVPRLKLDPKASSILSNPSQRIIVTIPSTSDWKLAQSTFDEGSVDHVLASRVKDAFESVSSVVLLPSTTPDSKENDLRQVLKAAPKGTTVTVLESSLERLKDHVELFGDHVPRPNIPDSKNKCIVPDRYLELRLAEWVTHPSQEASATMNPWMDLLLWEDLERMVAPAAFE